MVINEKAKYIKDNYLGSIVVDPMSKHAIIIGVDLNPDSEKSVLVMTNTTTNNKYNYHSAKNKAGSYFRGFPKDFIQEFNPKGFMWVSPKTIYKRG